MSNQETEIEKGSVILIEARSDEFDPAFFYYMLEKQGVDNTSLFLFYDGAFRLSEKPYKFIEV